MTAATATRQDHTISIIRPAPKLPIFRVDGPSDIFIRAGTTVVAGGVSTDFLADAPVILIDPAPGRDYGVLIDAEGHPRAVPAGNEAITGNVYFGGFHFAPAANARARDGGTAGAAINPWSCWDVGFRPACPDPRGMALVDMPHGGRFWADIYLLGVSHNSLGTSAYGATIADGRNRPQQPDSNENYGKLDYSTAVEIYKHHGKGLLSAEEFFAAAYGVKEKQSRGSEPKTTGEAEGLPFISKSGLFDITGSMWQWGTDGDPDEPRASIFGGSWVSGDYSGSRFARLGYWPDYSSVVIGARGRCDHYES